MIVLLGLGFISNIYAFNGQLTFPTRQFMINDEIYQLEIAHSRQQLQMGLMGRQSLAKNKGMLFVFPKVQRHGIWMKNMSISLTVAWLDKQFKVIYVNKLKPCQQRDCPVTKPQMASAYVIELNSDNQISIGDQIKPMMQYNPAFRSSFK